MGKNKLNKKQVATVIYNFLNEKGQEWDWDDFISIPIEDSFLESIRLKCASLPEEFPPAQGKGYCSEEGVKVLRKYLDELSK